jgi:cytochrome b
MTDRLGVQKRAATSSDAPIIIPAGSNPPDRIKVWDWPLRATHWALTFFVLLAWFTPSTFDSLHRFAGYAVMALISFRLIWGLFGSRFSRFHAIGRRLRAAPAYLLHLRHRRTGRYRGLNPAGSAMLVALLLLLGISTVTGWMSTTVRFFGVPWVEDSHSYVSNAVIVLVVVHVLGVLLMCALQRENLIRAMLTGWKRRGR